MSIFAGFAHPGVAVDRRKHRLSIFRNSQLVGVHARCILSDGRHLPSRHWIDNAQGAVALVRDYQRLSTEARPEQLQTSYQQKSAYKYSHCAEKYS